MRQALYLKLRDNLAGQELTSENLTVRPDFGPARDRAGRLHLGRRDSRFWPAAGVVLDVLLALESRVSDAATALGLSTANLIDFLQVDDKVWEQVNQMRSRFGHKPLH